MNCEKNYCLAQTQPFLKVGLTSFIASFHYLGTYWQDALFLNCFHPSVFLFSFSFLWLTVCLFVTCSISTFTSTLSGLFPSNLFLPAAHSTYDFCSRYSRFDLHTLGQRGSGGSSTPYSSSLSELTSSSLFG